MLAASNPLMVVLYVAGGFLVLMAVGMLFLLQFYRKVSQGQALIRNGVGGTKVSFSGMYVIPILHRVEYMDISVKRVEIDRTGAQGLICQDNLRADIKVAFFVRVNNTAEDVKKVAQALGCVRASDERALYELFDAKFSEALKTIGKRFDFAELYVARVRFKEEILQIIGTDLNGYVLEDAAIDYLEQTDKNLLNPNNILDAEGIKKITVLTAEQYELANAREREKDKTITKQNVEAQEAILVLNRQLAEAEAKQKREIASVQAREEAETKKIQAQEKEKSEKARISADEEIAVAEENRLRQIIVAAKNKDRTDAVETERVERDRGLEATERERLVTIAQVEKDKVIEGQKKELQSAIRERVIVEKSVVTEEERIKDTRAFAGADRQKRVAITDAEEKAEQALVKDIKAAEASKKAAEHFAEQQVIEAQANLDAAGRNADAKRTLAEADVKVQAVGGFAEAEVMEAKAIALEKQGTAEANVMGMKYHAEADGIRDKAEAMKIFDAVGKEHEEFKLQLNKDLQIELAEVNVHKDIAAEQAKIVGEALKSAKIDIVGGDNNFFNRLVNSITTGKQVDRMIDNSQALSGLKETLLGGDPEMNKQKIREFISQFGLSSEDIKNLSVSALVVKLLADADEQQKGTLNRILAAVKELGIGDMPAKKLLGNK
ncbi:MAG: hypothetical protein JW828_08305 [Sedimentisphaerales bacterium]|nr:hypothetical protein [Sedimentisphaerales bacterium]